MKILVATNNKHKLTEMSAILCDLGIDFISPKDLNIDVEIEETGSTFEENALLKAREMAKISGLDTIADDSGLMVDALGGEPGVYSARYAGEGASDLDKINKLLSNMKDVPQGERSAKFVCVIAFCRPEGGCFTARGECEGEMLYSPKGTSGFGYDPVFYIKEYDKTFAELDFEIKNKISHRARALNNFKESLNEFLKGENNAEF